MVATFDDIATHRDELVVLLGPNSDVGRAIAHRRFAHAESLLRDWQARTDRIAIELVSTLVPPGSGTYAPPNSMVLASRMLGFAREHGVPAVLTNAVRAAEKSSGRVVDVLDAVRRLVPLDERHRDQVNHEAYLKSGAQMAHIAEHTAFKYRQMIEERLGATLPAPNEEMPEQVEVQLSKLVAQASQQLLAMDKAKAAQQQAQQMAQDPIVQMQQAELQIKSQEAQTRAQKVQGDLAIKQAELQLKAQEVASRSGEDPAIAAARAEQEIMQSQQKHALEMRQEQEAFAQKMEQQRAEAAFKEQQRILQALTSRNNTKS